MTLAKRPNLFQSGQAALLAQPLSQSLTLLLQEDAQSLVSRALAIPNDTNLQRPSEDISMQIEAAQAKGQPIALHFPKFTDGRAFSQAVLLRRRFGFSQDIIATGDVLADQLQQMARCGFSVAILAPGSNLAQANQILNHYTSFYQADDRRVSG